MYIAIVLIISLYVLVSFVIIQITPLDLIKADPSNVIGSAANILMGRAGFIAVGVVALLACAAAVNATIFTATRVLGVVVSEHSNMQWLSQTLGRSQTKQLLISSLIVIALVLGFPLEIVGKMASMAFLLLFSVISYGHILIRHQTGANPYLLWCGVVINLILFISLLINEIKSAPAGVIVLGIALLGTLLMQLKYQFTKA